MTNPMAESLRDPYDTFDMDRRRKAAEEIERLTKEVNALRRALGDATFRQMNGLTPVLRDLPDEPSRKPCPMDGQAIDTSRAENECTCTLAATTAEHAVHDAITRALTEAGVKQEVLVGMCIEVGLEAYRDAVNRRTGP